jgi:hypothetical protein
VELETVTLGEAPAFLVQMVRAYAAQGLVDPEESRARELAIRKRLGHQNLQTTLRYAEQSDAAADAELRAWRRRRRQ